MSCSTSPDAKSEKAIRGIREAAAQGAEIVCLQELFRSQYFCREENAELFNLAETIPGPSTEALASVAKELQVAIVASLFEKRAHGLYHNTAAVLDADGSLIGIYRKMHIPDDPLYFEKFYFTPGISGSRISTRVTPASAYWCVGTNGIRRGRGSRVCKARMFCSIRLRLGGIHPRRSGMEKRSWMRGVRFSARTQSLMAYSWPQ